LPDAIPNPPQNISVATFFSVDTGVAQKHRAQIKKPEKVHKRQKNKKKPPTLGQNEYGSHSCEGIIEVETIPPLTAGDATIFPLATLIIAIPTSRL
jgi:hypothetical protein